MGRLTGVRCAGALALVAAVCCGTWWFSEVLSPRGMLPAAVTASVLPAPVVIVDLTSQAGVLATFEVRLADGAGSPLVKKKVELVDGARKLGAGKTGADGRFVKGVKLKTGTHNVFARFKGDRTLAASTSGSLAVTIAAPALISPGNGVKLDGLRPSLEWATVAGATSYRVRLQSSPDAATELTVTGTSTRVPTLKAGHRYTWSVVALLAKGESLPSATWSFETPGGGERTWAIEIVDGDGYTGSYPSIAVDSSDLPHIIYLSDTTEMYRLAERTAGGGWSFADVGTARGPYSCGERSDIAIDAQDRVHLTWHEADVAYKYMRRDGGVVAAGPVAIPGGSASAYIAYVSLAVSTGGTPFVAGWLFDLLGATDYTLGAWEGVGSFTPIEVGTYWLGAGRYCSAAVGPSGLPRVAYQSMDELLYPASRLRYASWNGSMWSGETVATDLPYSTSSNNNFENAVSLAVDDQDRPRIVYAVNGKYFCGDRDGGSWVFAEIGQTIYAEFAGASVAVGPDGAVHVAYMAKWAELWHAVRSGGSWSSRKVDTIGVYPSIAVDSSGGVHIACYDDRNGDLRYAYLAPQ